MDLPKNRVVVITGASSGIGRATALAFARDGARLVIGARNGAKLARVAQEINELGGEAIAKPTDVKKRQDVKALITIAVRKWHNVHVLINNAGVGLYGPVESIWDGDFEHVMKTNVQGAIYGIQEVIPVMKEQGGGQIINVTSTLGRIGMPLMSVYCMSKFALEALSQSLRVELKPFGISVVVVAPGITATEFNSNAKVRGMKSNPASLVSGRRTPEAVAKAILRASKRSRRDVVLNAGSRALLAINAVSPRLTDWGFHRWMAPKWPPPPEPKGDAPPPAPEQA